MSRIDLTSIGIRLYYGEGTENSKPASWADYVHLTGLKEIPEMNPSPDTIESTTFDEEEYKTYVEGLKDLGGALGFNFNLTQNFIDNWDTLLDTYESASDPIWFLVDIPGISKVFCFKGIPSPIGMSGIGINAILEITAYITPISEAQWETSPPNLNYTETPDISLDGTVVSWDEILNGTKYKIYRSDTSGGERTLIGITSGTLYDLSYLEQAEHYITVDVEGRHYNPKKSNEVLLDLS